MCICASVISVCFTLVVILSSATSSSYSTHLVKRQASCNRLQWRCSNGQCIPSYNVCDGPKDCSDGSDETKRACRAINIRCPPLAFECSYGACIDKELKCNGVPDCADGSDEVCSAPGVTAGPGPPAASCASSKFQCDNGQCIEQYLRCDGNPDCSDKSDETKTLCKSLKCPSNSFQCDYGACLERTVKCNGKPDCPDGSDEWNCPTTAPTTDNRVPTVSAGGCRLPEHPKHGLYVSALCQPGDSRQACRNLPGTPVNNNWLLKYSCNAKYDLTSSDSEYSVCESGVWKNPLDCIKLCEPLKSLSVELRCWYAGREIPCDKPMKPETYATTKCKQHYQEAYTPQYSKLVCQGDGTWNYPLYFCKPDCGVSTKPHTLTTLILNGSSTYQGEFPWLAALYLQVGDRWEQKCGGTLITPHIVLTAAHCLVLPEGPVTAPGIKVGLGKYYRDYYKQEPNSVIADVREIVTPRYYSGLAALYALDIGLLDLTVSVQVNAYIMPACVDWQHKIKINSNEVGHVAGWGTTENTKSSETVLSAQLTYIDNAACITQVREAYRRFVTHDKFCAGSVAGSQVDKGDSGGGLTIVRDQEQHFVFGVVSSKITEVTTFSLFTDVSNAEHHTWLEEHTNRLNTLHKES